MFPLMIALVLYLSLIVACGHYTARYAQRRGRSRRVWFIWGALLYPLPYLALALLPPVRGEKSA